MSLSLRPEQKKYVLIPVMLGLSFFLDHYKGRIGRTLQADAAALEFLDPACRPQPVYHTILPTLQYLQRQFHHRATHPTEKKLFELLDQQGSLGMYTKLPSPHLSHASSEFADDIQRYKKTTELARILDYCHATREEVTPIFMKWSQDGDLHNFPWYQWYVKMQYAYATHAKGMKRVVAPTFLAHIDSTAAHQDIQAFINLFPTASSMGLPSFVSLEQDDTWSHTWHLEKDNVCRKIETTHLTHGQAQDDFEKAGIAICSSVC